MANPVIRESGQTPLVATQTTPFSTSSAVSAGDLMVMFHALDYYAASNLLTPTGGSGSWTLQATGDGGPTAPSIKLWTMPVTAAGVQTVTLSQTFQSNSSNYSAHYCHWFVINGSSTTLSVDGVAGFNGTTASATMTMPSVSPAGADDLWIGSLIEGTNSSGTFTTPSGFAQFASQSNTGAATIATYDKLLTASGAVGTVTVTYTNTSGAATTNQWASAAIAIQSVASAASPVPAQPISLNFAVQRAASW